MIDPLEYYEKIGAALFPIPYGSKAPGGLVESFKKDFSRDPDQWKKWRSDHNCNFGLVAFASNLIVIDIDTSGDRNEAWKLWCELCASWGLPAPLAPHVNSARGGWHVLCSIPSDVNPATLRQPDVIRGRINVRCIGYVVAAGSFYDGSAKGEQSGFYSLISDTPPHPAPAALIEHCSRRSEKPDGANKVGQYKFEEVKALYEWMAERGEFDSYEDWLQAGMIAKLEFGARGFELWESTWDETVTPDTAGTKWRSFSDDAGPNSVTLASLMSRAHKMGWGGNLKPPGEKMFDGVAQSLAPSIAPDSPVPVVRLIQSSAEFVANFVAPSYLLDGILQKHFVYALTAATGAGKTAIALRLAAHVALGRKLGDRDVERGRVLYFAAENYVDVQARWIAGAQHCGFDVNTIDAYFVSGATKLSEIADRITSEAQALGDLALVIVDTSAATFEGSDENSNVDGLQHAKRMRSLTELPGNPTALILCHPVKSATNDNLLPRGGGSFIAEIDGNLCARKNDSAVEVHWAGKFRGMDFAPITFRLDTVTAERLKDVRGRSIPTVLASPIDDAAKQVLAATERSDQDRVLRAIYEAPGKSYPEIAKHLGWTMAGGRPYSVKVRRAAERLAGDGLILKHRDHWVLSSRGEKELNKLDRVHLRVDSETNGQNSGVSPMPALPVRIA